MTAPRVPVLIVGGSLVGLTTSLLLATQGVPHLLVERHRGTAIHPRAASFHQRTMEVFRSVGLQEAVERAAGQEVGIPEGRGRAGHAAEGTLGDRGGR